MRHAFVLATGLLLTTTATAQQPCSPQSVIVPYRSPGYRYLILPNVESAPPGWEQPEFDDSRWRVGCAPFVTSFCGVTACTPWDEGPVILLRKSFDTPGCNLSSAEVAAAIDNEIQVWINGVDRTGRWGRQGCAEPDNVVIPFDPRSIAPRNLLAALGVDRGGGARGIDLEIRGDGTLRPCTIIGSGHLGMRGLVPICVTPPRAGWPFCLSFSDPNPAGFNLIFLAPAPALNPPLSILSPVVCAPALFYVGPPIFVSERTGNPVGFCIVIPDEPALVGQSFVLQGAALELTGCFRASDGLCVTVQP